MDKLKEILGMMPEQKVAMGHAAGERVSALKRLRKKVTKEGFDPHDIDAELELWKGTKDTNGLFWVLDVTDAQEAKEDDPIQRDIEDAPDYRTWELTTDQVRELISSEISERPGVEAIQILNALEDGENEREMDGQSKPRRSVLDVIRDARRPLVAKVDKGKITVTN